ncbi:hypothetical protein ACP70R_045055 [Stipagrostis hirtigluma subsp. patula]
MLLVAWNSDFFVEDYEEDEMPPLDNKFSGAFAQVVIRVMRHEDYENMAWEVVSVAGYGSWIGYVPSRRQECNEDVGGVLRATRQIWFIHYKSCGCSQAAPLSVAAG